MGRRKGRGVETEKRHSVFPIYLLNFITSSLSSNILMCISMWLSPSERLMTPEAQSSTLILTAICRGEQQKPTHTAVKCWRRCQQGYLAVRCVIMCV